jgi:predicted AAA+ superfamily ATPase
VRPAPSNIFDLEDPRDENPRPGRFFVLGSASPDLVGLAAESLAGRVTLVAR